MPAGLVPATTAPEAAPAQTRPPDRRVPTRVQQQYLGPGLSQRRCLPQRMGLRQPHLITAVLAGASWPGPTGRCCLRDRREGAARAERQAAYHVARAGDGERAGQPPRGYVPDVDSPACAAIGQRPAGGNGERPAVGAERAVHAAGGEEAVRLVSRPVARFHRQVVPVNSASVFPVRAERHGHPALLASGGGQRCRPAPGDDIPERDAMTTPAAAKAIASTTAAVIPGAGHGAAITPRGWPMTTALPGRGSADRATLGNLPKTRQSTNKLDKSG